ncbi:hypothetical protein HYW75_04090 [Candidatus Pacearchaeota archaeon]|nr:hypothetical protein [Candidatus Pacearchaeota archaeon]
MTNNTRISTYELQCLNGEYEKLLECLKHHTFFQGTLENGRPYFITPSIDARITFDDQRVSKSEDGKDVEGKVLMYVERTSRREPDFVKFIVKRLAGRDTGSGGWGNLADMIELYLGKDYGEFKRKYNV